MSKRDKDNFIRHTKIRNKKADQKYLLTVFPEDSQLHFEQKPDDMIKTAD